MMTNLRTALFLASVVLVVSSASVLAHTDVTPEEARDLIASTADLVVVDVRERSEYCDSVGHIPGAVNYPLSSGVLQARYEELPMDRPILVVCRSGGRSNQAATFLDDQGFPEVYDMTGGIDPYQIATATDLIALGETPEDYDKHFVLTADIDLDPNLPGGKIFEGTVIPMLYGVLDGAGHIISQLTIRAPERYAGLFGRLATTATVRDLGLVAVDIVGSANCVGGLVGDNTGTLTNCYSTGKVGGLDYVGGLAGDNSGTLADCHSMGTVTGLDYAGGLIGHSREGDVKDSYSASQVTGHHSVGGLVGRSASDVTGCHSAGAVNGSGWQVGGLVGTYAGGVISNSFATSDVTGHNWVGGLVGEHYAGMIMDCHAVGAVVGNDSVGGLVGVNRKTVVRCDASGDVTGRSFVGGFVGVNGDIVTHCWSSGAVSGDENVGGLVGDNSLYAISNSYSTGSVSGRESVGGLVGYSAGTVLNSYSTGPVTGEDMVGGLVGYQAPGVVSNSYSVGAVDGISDRVGGLVGRSGGNVSASFWDTNSSRQATSAGGEGLTTTQMQDRQTFTDASWDFVGEQGDGLCEIWQMPADSGYPVLGSFNGYVPADPNGEGSLDHPYLLRSPADLSLLYHRPAGCFRLVSDIDLSGFVWRTAAIPVFSGRFDGEHHRITNVTVLGSGSLGFFAYIGENGVILNLGIEGAYVSGRGDWVGILVGLNGGTVSACYGDGTVYGTRRVGLLVGENQGTISNSRSTGDVSGYENVGGLVGHNWAAVSSSFSMASVSGSSSAIGGLVGYNDYKAVISNSYSMGPVSGGRSSRVGGLLGDDSQSVVTGCFWDVEATGQDTSAGGTGLTTAEMQMAAMFLEAGWDFVGEAENGTEDIWWIDEGQDYPRLWWESANAEF